MFHLFGKPPEQQPPAPPPRLSELELSLARNGAASHFREVGAGGVPMTADLWDRIRIQMQAVQLELTAQLLEGIKGLREDIQLASVGREQLWQPKGGSDAPHNLSDGGLGAGRLRDGKT